MERRTSTQFFYFFLLLLFPFSFAMAQNAKVTGAVTDEKNQPVAYATVAVVGTTNGTTTDLNGKFELTIDKPGTYTIQVSYVGYTTVKQQVVIAGTETQTIAIQLKPSANNLDELVVIGYGTAKKSDLTGSVSSIDAKDFNTGDVQTPEQLIQGKVAGVEITPNGGSPGGGSVIRIRGLASLNATNDPLFVIDGVPIDVNLSIPGSPNPLSLINPADIENITVLKDASATAIYGSRASNGVIIVTTKKGSVGKFTIGLSAVNSISMASNYVNVLSPAQFKTLVDQYGSAAQQAIVGKTSTDWQKQIYRVAPGTDENLSFTGGIKKLPYRLSLEYFNQDGILITDNMQREAADLSLTPTFFKDHLSITANEKASFTQNHFANQSAVGDAVFYDPTQPVLSGSPRYGGYYEWLSNGLPTGPNNPVGLINQKDDISNVSRSIGNALFDYKVHFLPDLHVNLNLGYDLSEGKGSTYIPDSAASNYVNSNYNAAVTKDAKYKYERGYWHTYDITNLNKLLEFYLNYKKNVKAIKSVFEAVAGYTYQDWKTTGTNNNNYYASKDTVIAPPAAYPPTADQENTLISFYGRFNYALNDKYLLTASIRDDGSSRFATADRWGQFPSIALAWKINEESFLKNSKLFSDLKLRLGYGQTGNQDGFSQPNNPNILDYPYINQYTYSNGAAQYQFGNTYYNTLRPAAVDPNIKWESTAFTNIGLDYGFWKNRIFGSVDYYYKKTTNMIATIPIPQGTNFSNEVLTNVGNMENKGVEFSISIIPIAKKNTSLEFDYNITYNQNKVLGLSKTATDTGEYLIGNVNGSGLSNTIQVIKAGYPLNSFLVYKQYYVNSKPQDGEFYYLVNGSPVVVGTGAEAHDSITNKPNSKDLYISNKSPFPKVYMGFTAKYRYKKWSAQAVLRGSFGNYVYNNVASQSTISTMLARPQYLDNGTTDVLNTDFKSSTELLSDYYIQNASFVKLDNLTLSYDVGRILKNKATLKVSVICQNVVTFTPYKGLDPEIYGGIDNTIYPRPRIFSLGLSVLFN